ncbi:MAG TPA: glycerol-3-phosphate acyltransferase, partial [Bacilli bacterium]|nr:glycerol-3-phosphate acyltransferase [Bacilli bacterium]
MIAAYLLGSIPFALIIGKLVKGIDIREHGSRNMGATNALRVLGIKWGIIVFALDMLKAGLI